MKHEESRHEENYVKMWMDWCMLVLKNSLSPWKLAEYSNEACESENLEYMVKYIFTCTGETAFLHVSFLDKLVECERKYIFYPADQENLVS